MRDGALPSPRPAIADPTLVRPNWVAASVVRNPDMLWLDKNENDDPELAETVRLVTSSLGMATQYSYPDLGPLYARLGAWAGVRPEALLLTAGSDGVIQAVFGTFVSPGETVLHTSPTFAMYSVYSKIFGARARTIDYARTQGGPLLESSTIIDAIQRERPRLVCLANPDSPTGTVFSPHEMRAIIEAARDVGAVMLVDEAYFPFHGETCIGWIENYRHLVIARTFSKAWGMAGFRVGYAVAHPDLVRLLHKGRPMYEIGAISAAAVTAMLGHVDAMEASVRRLEAGKRLFLDAMENLGFRVLRGAGNFAHVAFGDRAEVVHAALANLVFYRKDFSEPCLQGFSRFSATTEARFTPVISRIKASIPTIRR